jgi:transcriptional regulator with XRE-family HTH domain
MTSTFWDNVLGILDKQGKSQKWLADKSKVGRTLINSGIARGSSPSANNSFAIAKALGITIEELIAGEEGREYIKDCAQRIGAKWKLPENIADIVEMPGELEDSDIENVASFVKGVIATKGKKEMDEGHKRRNTVR